MTRRRRFRRPNAHETDPDLDRALEAMTAPELRSFVRGVLDGIDEGRRATFVDSLVARAAKGDAGWKPSPPSRRIVDEATQFAQAARRIGSADPDDVSAHLRQGSQDLSGWGPRKRSGRVRDPPAAHGERRHRSWPARADR